jgi:hypothetical protein
MRVISSATAFALATAAATAAYASLLTFDPDGPGGANGAVQVATFDLAPGNSIAVDGVPLAVMPSSQNVNQYFQGRLGGFLDGNADPVTGITGLNSAFELTVVAGATTTGQIVTGSATSAIATFALAATPTVNYVEIYYDNNPLTFADDLAGTGFRDGTLIMTALVSDISAVFSSSFGPGSIVLFDQFQADTYGGKQSVTGNGSLSFDATVTNRNAGFFQDDVLLVSMSATTNNVTPFKQTNPSGLFEIGPNGSVVNHVPDLGNINGLLELGDNGPRDIQLQTDASASFTVIPEPASLSLLALAGVAGMIRRRRA